MIEGIVIASAPMSTMERFDYLANFVPKIHDWATCDCVAATFRIREHEREEYWDFIMRYRKSTSEFEVRFICGHDHRYEFLPLHPCDKLQLSRAR